MKQLPTPLRLLLMLGICLLAFSPAAYADCTHNSCSDGSCDYIIDSGYVGRPVGDRDIYFDTINICEDELCPGGNCSHNQEAAAACPNSCYRCDDAEDCTSCSRCRYTDNSADKPSSQRPSYNRYPQSYNPYGNSSWSIFSNISSIMQGNSYFDRISPLLKILMQQRYGNYGYRNYPGYYYNAANGENSTMKPDYSNTDADLTAFRTEVLRLVNKERTAMGLPALKSHSALNSAAQVRADEISTAYGHNRPDGSSCFTVLQEKSISHNYAGENIASGQTTPEQVVREWMNSPGHRANILNTKYTYLGIGITKNRNGRYGGYSWAQMFIG